MSATTTSLDHWARPGLSADQHRQPTPAAEPAGTISVWPRPSYPRKHTFYPGLLAELTLEIQTGNFRKNSAHPLDPPWHGVLTPVEPGSQNRQKRRAPGIWVPPSRRGEDQMRRRLPIGPGQARLGIATGAAALAAISVLTGCGSSSSGGSSSSTTLTFFGADYGTGPANSTTKYWDAIAAAFHKANPGITVNVQTVDWTDFPNKVADPGPEQAVPRHPRGRRRAAVRAEPPALPRRPRCCRRAS